jgi:hypothetical protein
MTVYLDMPSIYAINAAGAKPTVMVTSGSEKDVND